VKIVATYAIKGGVGKTTAAINLAYLAGKDGFRVLVWDLDPQGAATFLFRVRPKVKGGARSVVQRGGAGLAAATRETDLAGVDLVPSDFSYRNLDLVLDAGKKPVGRLRRALRPLQDEYELVVLDCPPGISLLSESVIDAADVLVVPVVPSLLAVRSLDQLTDFLSDDVRRPPEVVAFLMMVDSRKRFHREMVASLPSGHAAIRPIAVPASAVVERMAVERAPVCQYAPRASASLAFDELWSEVRSTALRH
jgi:cellulose biosynthesis protein BcsQ